MCSQLFHVARCWSEMKNIWEKFCWSVLSRFRNISAPTNFLSRQLKQLTQANREASSITDFLHPLCQTTDEPEICWSGSSWFSASRISRYQRLSWSAATAPSIQTCPATRTVERHHTSLQIRPYGDPDEVAWSQVPAAVVHSSKAKCWATHFLGILSI